MIYGTSHFVNMYAAVRYYARQHETQRDVERKLAEGLIHIGPPTLEPGQVLSTIVSEGRYQIEEGIAE